MTVSFCPRKRDFSERTVIPPPPDGAAAFAWGGGKGREGRRETEGWGEEEEWQYVH